MSAILGINSAYHESCAALVVDGLLVAACEEERFNRIKHAKPAGVDPGELWPERAVQAVLRQGGLEPEQIHAVAYSFLPRRRLANIGIDQGAIDPSQGWGTEAGERSFVAALEGFPQRAREALGHAVEVVFLPHHLCHAASAYYAAPCGDAALLVVDGIAELDSTWLGHGRDGSIRKLESLAYPHSLGLLWERCAQFCGMSAYDAAKVMGMAAYGEPGRFERAMGALLAIDPQGLFQVGPEAALRSPDFAGLESLFGPARRPGEGLRPHHFDLAAALQARSEEVLLHLARRLKQQLSGSRLLALAGGVALNCVANGRLLAEAPFDELYVQPAANDAGTALGAAWLLAQRRGELRSWQALRLPLLGPSYSPEDVGRILGRYPRQQTPDAAADAARQLAQGRLVGWFRGRMELGPRALGARSILADPRDPATRQVLNRKIKHREDFRPFACCVLEEALSDWFELPPQRSLSLYQMLLVFPIRPERQAQVPAVVHADGSCRLQVVSRALQPELHRLISLFAAETGVPLLLNTSFNDSEPIVQSPEDALQTFFSTQLDVLYLEGIRVDRPDKASIPPPAQRFAPAVDRNGTRLALVFGNQAAQGLCPYYVKGECWHCDIGAGEGQALSDAQNRERLTWFRAHYAQIWPELAHLVVYNSGSVLNPKELPRALLGEILAFANRLPALRRLSLDSREGFIRRSLLQPLADQLDRRILLQPILGLETADTHVRMELLGKRMSARSVVRAFDEVARCEGNLGIAVNLVLGLPGVADARADALSSARWMAELAAARGLPLELNLHPYYPSQRGRERFPQHPRLDPEVCYGILAALDKALAPAVGLFLGMHDEDHDTEPEARATELAAYQRRFSDFLAQRSCR